MSKIVLMNDHITIIKKLSKLEPTYDHTWVGSNPNRAFLICIGVGPWRINRRKRVQEDAMYWLGNRDLGDIHYRHFYNNIYPFQWQNNMLFNMIVSLEFEDIKFSDKCHKWKNDYKNWRNHVLEFFNMCGSPKGTKVLWLFIRDFLQFPAFPIDRWVRRALNKYNLPCDPWYIIKICLKFNICPNKLNRVLFSGENSDFSVNFD